MTRRLTHGDRVIAIIMSGVAWCAALLLFAAHQPWLGLDLAVASRDRVTVVAATGPAATVPAGTGIETIGAGEAQGAAGAVLRLIPRDLLIEPDGNLARFSDYDAFLARQDQLHAIKSAPQVTLRAHDGRHWTIAPEPWRPLTHFPAEFWVQLFVGLVAWLISGCIWAFRPADRSARYLLLSGASTLVFAPCAGIYGTRELAMAALPFRLLSDANFLGGSLFLASLIALMLYYPRAMAPRWVGLAAVALYAGWFAAQALGAMDSMVFARRFLVFAGLGATFVLAAVQWRRTAADPVGRAAFQWFLLSWLVGCSAFSALIFVPQVFGVDTSALQGYGFLLFVPIYGGLAAGIMRYRLFDLGQWWARVMTWALSIVLLVLLDMLFLLVLNLSPGLSVGLALLLCGLAWLPLRGWLWGRLVLSAPVDGKGRFRTLADAAFRPTPHERAEGWRALLQHAYAPLEAEPAPRPVPAVRIEDDGLALLLPSAGEAPALRLAHPAGGRRLFNRADVELAQELVEMFDHLVHSRSAFDAGAATERSRIARDIHDHVGAALLDALHSDEPQRKDRMIRETLLDLRGIVNGVGHAEQPLAQALVQIRREIADRLEAKAIRLDWTGPTGEARLGAAKLHALRSILREAVSNAIKHADCATMRIALALEGEALVVTVADDGGGFDPSAPSIGAGLANMRDRARAVGGELCWQPEMGSFSICLRLTLSTDSFA